jgi:hypothetical protein
VAAAGFVSYQRTRNQPLWAPVLATKVQTAAARGIGAGSGLMI